MRHLLISALLIGLMGTTQAGDVMLNVLGGLIEPAIDWST
jgi:hypothetical protein